MGVYLYPSGTETELKNAYIWWVREPWSNTVLYYPFNSDQTDHVWSSSLDTTGTQQTLGYSFSPSNRAYVTNPPTTCRFINIWIKWVSSSWNYVQWPSTYIGEVLYDFAHAKDNWNQKFQYKNWLNESIYWDAVRPSSNVVATTTWPWYNMAYWTDGSKVVAYLNGSKVWETAVNNGLWTVTTMTLCRYWTFILSEFIGESAIWSDAEVLSYYNNTKSNYWL